MFPDIGDSDTRRHRAHRYVPRLPTRTWDRDQPVDDRCRVGRFESSNGDRDTLGDPGSVCQSWIGATTAPALPSSEQKYLEISTEDLQSRTVFPVDLSLPRDNSDGANREDAKSVTEAGN